MALNVEKEVAQMERMSVSELRDKFAEVCGEPTKGRNRQWLIKRIAWRIQANVFGGLSAEALQRAREIANFADLRLTAPRAGTSAAAGPPPAAEPLPADKRLPMPGTILTREYKGRVLQVEALNEGFAFEAVQVLDRDRQEDHRVALEWLPVFWPTRERSGAMKRESQPPVVRCAIYTRKSTEEGLEQEFNSLDAQRESAEAYIASMKHEGWHLVAERYDDGGYTGGNVARPALQRLLDGIQGGSVDCVIVYKVDRLSRSLLDFARLMQLFEQQRVAFVSVTQRFDTSNSMGRLTLNMLMSFAQFEREMISERTRDKIAATRRKGKWTGGMPLLGFDVVDSKLVVNQDEAERVRQIFDPYLERQSLLATANELNRRGWTTKTWTTKKGIRRGGLAFGKTNLHQLLSAMRCAVADEDGHEDLHLDFYDRNRLATWVRDYPGLIVWVRQRVGRGISGWQPYSSWAVSPDGVEDEYLLDDKTRIHFGAIYGEGFEATRGITQLRNILREAKGVVRLTGLSGVGKTRLVQSLFDSRVGNRPLDSSLAIYTDMTDNPTPQPIGMISDLIASRRRAIVVIDNCPPDLHRRTTEVCKGGESVVSVITVEYDVQDDEPEGD